MIQSIALSRLIRARMNYICIFLNHSDQIMHCQLVFYVQTSQIMHIIYTALIYSTIHIRILTYSDMHIRHVCDE